MAFLGALAEELPVLVANGVAQQGTSLLNSLITHESNELLSGQNATAQMQALRYTTEANTANAQAGRNFTGDQMTLNRATTQNMFNTAQTNALKMQQNSFNNQQMLQSNALSSMRTNLGISGGLGLLGTIGNIAGSAILNNQSASLQRQNFDYMTGKMQQSFESAGLPSWLAFSPGSANLFPRSTQIVNGSNTFSSQLPGNPMATPWTGSDSQITMGVGNIPTAF